MSGMNRHTARQTAKRALQVLFIALGLAFVYMAASVEPAAADPSHDPTEFFNWTDLDYKDKNIAGGELKEGQPGMSPPMMLLLMNFAIVLIIIGWKVRPLVTNYVKDRHENIRTALDEATELREQAQKKLDEYNEKLAAAEAEIEELISTIRTNAEAEKKRIMEDAEAQAAAMKKDAEARIAAEISNARAQLEREVVVAAIAAAEKLIKVTATSRDHTQLIDGFITDVGNARPAGDMKERV